MIPITNISLKELPKVVKDIGLKKYAAEQVISWLYKERVSSFDEMTNLSKGAREEFKKKYVIDAVKKEKVATARDGTKKYLMRTNTSFSPPLMGGDQGEGDIFTPLPNPLPQGERGYGLKGRGGHPPSASLPSREGEKSEIEFIECVFIPSDDDRATVCISTQAGCAMGCAFCRTAELGFKRNLTQGEILGQLLLVMREEKEPVTNVVLMGMGEPLANIEEVSSALEIMMDPRAFNISKRRVTLSTCGLVPKMEEFVKRFDIKLAISLNAATDKVREQIMPISKKYPIADILKFCRVHSKNSRYRITFEYVLIAGVNDSMEEAKKLIRVLEGISAKVNLIPFNEFEGSEFKAPAKEKVKEWFEYLHSRGVQVNVRISKGQEIMAACGQLAGS